MAGTEPAHLIELDAGDNLAIARFLGYLRYNHSEYYERLFQCASEIISMMDAVDGIIQSDEDLQRLRDSGQRAVVTYRESDEVKKETTVYAWMFNSYKRLAEEEAQGTPQGDIQGGSHELPAVEQKRRDPPSSCEMEAVHSDNAFSDFIRHTFYEITKYESTKLYSIKKRVMELIGRFYVDGSVFKSLGSPSKLQTETENMMNVLAPIQSPSMGDVSPFAWQPFLHEDTGKKFLVIKRFVHTPDQNQTVTPPCEKVYWFNYKEPLGATPDVIHDALRNLELEPIFASTSEFLFVQNTEENEKFPPVRPGPWIDGQHQVYGIQVTDSESQPVFRPLYIRRTSTRLTQATEINSLESFLRKYIYYVELRPTQDGDYTVYSPIATSIYNPDGTQGSYDPRDAKGYKSKLVDPIVGYNQLWKNYQRANSQWNDMERVYSERPIFQVVHDLLLLDLSRFGWAPCWSTPYNDHQIRNEDGNEHTFLNDMAQFLDSSQKKSPECLQTTPQWNVSKFMYSEDFRKLKRASYIRSIFKVNDVQKLVNLGSSLKNGQDDEVSRFSKWLKGEYEEGVQERVHENFVESVKKYSVAVETNSEGKQLYHNDVSALCVLTTLTRSSVKNAMLRPFVSGTNAMDGILRRALSEAWYDKLYQFSAVFTRFKWLHFKTMSVTAHETLKHGATDWLYDKSVAASFSRVRAGRLAALMEDISGGRSKLETDFVNHAHEVRTRSGFGSASDDQIVRNGLTCGMALRAIDDSFLCTRTRLVFKNKDDRDNALGILTTSLQSMTDDEAKALIEEWDDSNRNPAAKFFNRANAPKVDTFVRTFYEGLVPKSTEVKRNVFVRIATEYLASLDLKLTPRKTEMFVCDIPVDKVIAAAVSRANLDYDLSTNLKNSARVRQPNKQPMCFADPANEKELLLVCMLPVDRMVSKSGSDTTTVSDLEIDKFLKSVETDCPRHYRPSQSVQLEFKNVLKGKKIDVWRMDWWIGTHTGTPIDSYSAAEAFSPLIPYGFTRNQLNTRNDIIQYSQGDMAPAKNPFEGSMNLSRSIRATEDAFASITTNASAEDTQRQLETQTTMDAMFTLSAELQYQTSYFYSLARVCRIAFHIMTHGPISYNGASCYATSYRNVSDVASYSSEDDLLAWTLSVFSGHSSRRAEADANGYLGSAILPPFQHTDLKQQGGETRIIVAGPFRRNMLAFPHTSIGVFRLLQWRISTSSYYMDFVRKGLMRNQDIVNALQNLQTQAQAAWKYKNSHMAVSTFGNGVTVKTGSETLAAFLFPERLVTGRTTTEVTNGPNKVMEATENIEHYRTTAQLYMASCVSNLKFTISKTHPPMRTTSAGDDLIRFKTVARDMARIAEGMRMAAPLLAYMGHAAKSLKRTKSATFKWAPRAVEVALIHLGKLTNEFEHEHARFEDAVRSYADLASTGIQTVNELKTRFVNAYKKVRLFRKSYDSGITGFLIHISSLLKTAPLSRVTKSMFDSLQESVDVALTSDSFYPKSSTLIGLFARESQLSKWMQGMAVYTTLSARTHTNALLGCATAAVPYRDLPMSIRNKTYTEHIRTAALFDTVGGFIGPDSNVANFFCFLPTAKDVLQDGVAEPCHRKNTTLFGGKYRFVKNGDGKDDENYKKGEDVGGKRNRYNNVFGALTAEEEERNRLEEEEGIYQDEELDDHEDGNY